MSTHSDHDDVTNDVTKDLGFELPKAPKTRPVRLIAALLIGVAVIAALFVVGYLPKRDAKEALTASVAASEQGATRVEVLHPKPIDTAHELVLPGSVAPLAETTLYSRADGFVAKWHVDIGAKVTAGQLLAEIDTPELAQQLTQAKAELARDYALGKQARANLALAQTALGRYAKLSPEDVAGLDLDTKRAQVNAASAGVAAADAGVESQKAAIAVLEERLSFGRIEAPFAGTITRRGIDLGARVTATTALFDVAATDTVKVTVQVPQSLVPSVAPGVDAIVSVREYAGVKFAGKVARNAGELDQVRTLRTEIEVPNADGKLIPGMYGEVRLAVKGAIPLVEIPSTALYSDAKGTRVAVVDGAGGEGKVAFRTVTIERDTGATLHLSAGVTASDRVLKLANAALVEGQQVEAVEPPPESPKK